MSVLYWAIAIYASIGMAWVLFLLIVVERDSSLDFENRPSKLPLLVLSAFILMEVLTWPSTFVWIYRSRRD